MDESDLARRSDQFAEDEDEDFLSNPHPYRYISRSPPSLSEHLSDFLSPMPLSQSETILLGKEAIRSFLSTRTAYDAMPKSGRVVVFDVNINLKLVLYALLEHEIRGAPLWNPGMQKLVGVVTLSDFSDIFRHAYRSGEDAQAIMEAHTILTWRTLLGVVVSTNPEDVGRQTAASLCVEQQRKYPTREDLVSVTPPSTLLEACQLLKRNKVHRLPVIDPAIQTCLQVISHQSIIEYLTAQFAEERRLFDHPIYRLGVGSYCEPESKASFKRASKGGASGEEEDDEEQDEEDTDHHLPRAPAPHVAYLDTRLSEVARFFEQDADCSVVPVVDRNTNKVRELYRRSCLACLYAEPRAIEEDGDGDASSPAAASATPSSVSSVRRLGHVADPFALPMSQVLERLEATNPELLEPIRTCSPSSTLYQVFVQFAESKARVLVVVDEKGGFLGLCSLSDVLGYFVEPTVPLTLKRTRSKPESTKLA